MPLKTMKKPNELSALAAFIKILRSLTNVGDWKPESPDEVNRRTPDVDFVLVSSGDENDKIAAEHTIVESFDGQIEYVNRLREIECSVNAGCRERIPSDRYYFLLAPPILVDSLVGKSKALFVTYLSSWMVEAAPKLQVVDSYAQTEYKGHKMTLMCRGDHAQLNGNVWCMQQEPESRKALLSERLGQAISKKLPKLTKYKKPGFKTALLLEDVAGTLGGSTLRGYESSLGEVDYVVVFVSNERRMIIGNVWKEGPVWYSLVPGNRRFQFWKPQAM